MLIYLFAYQPNDKCAPEIANGEFRELKQTRRRRKRERHLKMQLRVSAINF